jgi:hypothetical protein
MRSGVGAHLRGDTADRELSWLNQNWGASLSADGSRLLFGDGTAGANYGVVWRKTDGSPIVQLGEGNPNGLSPDGELAFAQIFTPPSFVVYPLHAGETIHPKTGAIEGAEFVDWFPDGKSVLLVGRDPGKALRGYRLTLPDGVPVPVLPEGTVPTAVTRDGQFVLAFRGADAFWYPVGGGDPKPIPSIRRTDRGFVSGWGKDGRSPILQNGQDIPIVLDIIDFATGKRTPFKTVTPSDPTGLMSMGISSMSADGQQYAIAYQKKLSTLFVVTQSK